MVLIDALGIFRKKETARKNGEKQQAERKREMQRLSVDGKLKCTLAELRGKLNRLSIFTAFSEGEGGGLKASLVESTDRNKNPYLFMDFTFGKKGLDIGYSITPEVKNPSKRSLEVARTTFIMLALLESEGAFIPEKGQVYRMVVESLKLCDDFLDSDGMKLKYDFDRLLSESALMKTELAELRRERESLNYHSLEVEKKNQALLERVKQLETLTNKELDEEILRWVEEHRGALDEAKFCSSFKIKRARLEERLDSLSKAAVIRFV